jgi:hypothetical protein
MAGPLATATLEATAFCMLAKLIYIFWQKIWAVTISLYSASLLLAMVLRHQKHFIFLAQNLIFLA